MKAEPEELVSWAVKAARAVRVAMGELAEIARHWPSEPLAVREVQVDGEAVAARADQAAVVLAALRWLSGAVPALVSSETRV